MLAFAVTIFLSFKYIYLYDPPYLAPDQMNSKLEGIGGWLVLPALALLFNPVRIAMGSYEGWFIFSSEQWSIIGDQTGNDMLITLAFEAIFNVVMFVTSLFLIVLFFTRRHTFPILFITYFIIYTVMSGLDLLIVHFLPYPELEVSPSDYTDLIRMAAYTVVWSSYFIVSKRVKATFTRSHKSNKKQPSPVCIDGETPLQETV